MWHRIFSIPTGRYILAAYTLWILSVLISWIGKFIPYEASRATAVVEWIVMAMFSLSYISLWVLVVVGLLRPYSSFTRRGDKSKRIANFLYALGGLVMLHVFLAFRIATSGS